MRQFRQKSKNASKCKPIDIVSHAKLLGLNISCDLKWNVHISETVRKVSSRLYCLRQLKRAKTATKELITFYKTCIRPVSEYACQVYHNSLPKYLSDDLERLQKRALRIILPEKTYAAALESTGLAMMHDRRQTLTERLFSDIVSNKDHALHSLLPKVNCARPLRSNRCFNVPICKTNRFKNSFIMCNSSNCLESK